MVPDCLDKNMINHDDVIMRYWPFGRSPHRFPEARAMKSQMARNLGLRHWTKHWFVGDFRLDSAHVTAMSLQEGTTCEHVGYKNPLKIRMLLYHLIVIYIIPITITFVIYCMAIDRLRKDIKDEKENGWVQELFDTLRQRQNVRHFVDEKFMPILSYTKC